jgi:hypothetical protein
VAAMGGFVMRDGALDLENGPEHGDAQLTQERLLLAFNYSQATGATFSGRLQEAVQDFLPSVNRTYRSSPEAARALLKTLRAKGRVAPALRLMHELGYLGKFIPEFGRITASCSMSLSPVRSTNTRCIPSARWTIWPIREADPRALPEIYAEVLRRPSSRAARATSGRMGGHWEGRVI